MRNGFLILLSLLSINTFACPLGAKEDHLTIQRVMRNFGRYTRDAEMLVLQGIDNPSYVKEEILDKAITDLNIVVSCSEAVMANPTGDLLPTMGQDLKGSELQDYLKKINKYFSDFKSATLEFQRLLKVEKEKPVAQRNYRPAYTYDKEVFNAIIDEAHKELQ